VIDLSFRLQKLQRAKLVVRGNFRIDTMKLEQFNAVEA